MAMSRKEKSQTCHQPLQQLPPPPFSKKTRTHRCGGAPHCLPDCTFSCLERRFDNTEISLSSELIYFSFLTSCNTNGKQARPPRKRR